MATLGKPYTIMYIAIGRKTGLNGIYASVLKPDKSVAGVFMLTELTGLFSGCYIYDYPTSVYDEAGEYFSIVVSPSEANRTNIVRFELSHDDNTYQQQQVTSGVALEGVLTSAQITAIMPKSFEIQANLDNDNLSGQVEREIEISGTLESHESLGEVNVLNLKGEINEQLNLP